MYVEIDSGETLKYKASTSGQTVNIKSGVKAGCQKFGYNKS